METIICKIDRENLKESDLELAAQFIREGKLVAFPTETVYGLGGDAFDKTAAEKIYAAKGRPSDNPLIVHIADINALTFLAKEIPKKAYQLAEAFWPGPLTIILKKSDKVPYSTTGGLDTVAIRMPMDEIAAMLIKLSGRYIAAPSANTSGRPSTTKAEHVIEDLKGKIDMILDGGLSKIGLESTIVDLTEEIPLILRPGYLTKEQLEQVIGRIDYDKAILNKEKETIITAKAPGMKYKHYAPKANLTIYEGTLSAVVKAINKEAKLQEKQHKKVGILASDETADLYQYGIVKSLGSRHKEESITSHLFDMLREFDTLGADIIYAESFEEMQLGQAIMNRLLKAAGYQIISVKE